MAKQVSKKTRKAAVKKAAVKKAAVKKAAVKKAAVKKSAGRKPVATEVAKGPQRIQVPQPAPGAYNPNRPLEKNLLLKNQVAHFQLAEQKLPPERRTGVNLASVKTEGAAADYIRRMTLILHPQSAEPVRTMTASTRRRGEEE